ncbi:MAG: OmpA family protein [Prevotella sp.]|jgi:outer membrane protein OmpA-like peptidoglycan-associated protein|nr:OmpA family protein [Prevotella sp.]
MRRHSGILLALIVLLLTGCGAEHSMKKGEKFLAIGEYYEASNHFKQAYSRTKATEREKRGQRAAKMAYCYDRMGQTQKAIAAYRNVIRYKQDSLETHLAFARLLLKNGNYREAEREYQGVLDSLNSAQNINLSKDPSDIITLARNGITAARTAPTIKEQGSRYTVKKMDIFNSRRSDFSPMLYGDAFDQLYFTSTRNEAVGDELSGITGTKAGDIFYSEKDDKGKWGKPETIETGLNTEFDEGACCFSTDQREMYLTQCVTDPSYPRYATIAVAQRSDAAWGKATKMEITKDTLSSYAHPAISPDGQWLYFVSDMPGGKGGLDIWRIRLTSAGLGGVENVGAPVNTPGDEMFPTFRPNGDLYFSSDGHPGMGGLDVFIATVGSNGRYQLEHPGYPLNSHGDDFGLTFEGVHNRGFFSSNRDNGRGFDHIYSFENSEIIQSIKGWVYEMDGYELPAAQVYLVGDDGTNMKLSVKGDGSFEQVIKPNVHYVMLASCKGFLNHKEELCVEPATDSEEYTLQFPLASIRVPVLIDNIFYDFDKATLRPESTAALDELVKMLQENPNVTIELSAHCDYRGSASYNKTLSQHRAQAVVDYLIAHGIPADRLTPVGYGKEKPKTIRKKLTEKYPWLKENDVLSEEFIKKLNEEQQEICNQLNRRTEFIVLRTTYGMFDEKGQLKNPPKPKEVPAGDIEEEYIFD